MKLCAVTGRFREACNVLHRSIARVYFALLLCFYYSTQQCNRRRRTRTSPNSSGLDSGRIESKSDRTTIQTDFHPMQPDLVSYASLIQTTTYLLSLETLRIVKRTKGLNSVCYKIRYDPTYLLTYFLAIRRCLLTSEGNLSRKLANTTTMSLTTSKIPSFCTL